MGDFDYCVPSSVIEEMVSETQKIQKAHKCRIIYCSGIDVVTNLDRECLLSCYMSICKLFMIWPYVTNMTCTLEFLRTPQKLSLSSILDHLFFDF